MTDPLDVLHPKVKVSFVHGAVVRTMLLDGKRGQDFFSHSYWAKTAKINDWPPSYCTEGNGIRETLWPWPWRSVVVARPHGEPE